MQKLSSLVRTAPRRNAEGRNLLTVAVAAAAAIAGATKQQRIPARETGRVTHNGETGANASPHDLPRIRRALREDDRFDSIATR
jgi:hypothetical protein